MTTIEGNTNEAGSREGTAVLRKVRGHNVVRSFIRLPVTVAYDERLEQCLLPANVKPMSIEEFLSRL